ncbi:MAG: glycosyltransferase [Bacteroidales bacterium]|jgi:glycosyltransferase involved in cell wall biosynthesis
MQLPRVLIFGQPFNRRYGGGITLSNLFSGWEKDKIAVVAGGHTMYSVTTDICNNYYQLGKNEVRWIFPFNLIQRQFRSGRLTFNSSTDSIKDAKKKNRIRSFTVNQLFYPMLEWLGLFHCLFKTRLSPELKIWLSEFKPEVLYLQVSTRDTVVYATKLVDYLGIPAVIHNMDDWPSTVSTRGIFKKYWSRRIDKEFGFLLKKVSLALSISDAMSEAYLKRYNISFIPFHNPIETYKYNYNKTISNNTRDMFRILYMGRIGLANKETIKHFAEVISRLDIEGITIEFEIYTSDYNKPFSARLSKFKSVKINPPIEHEAVPALLNDFDLLLLPLDFTRDGEKYAQYSIPTKASEYMASGTPILVYAPQQTAIVKFCTQNNCGHCVTDIDPEKIKEAIKTLINNEDYRQMLSTNAIKIAFSRFDATKVRNEFRELLLWLSTTAVE